MLRQRVTAVWILLITATCVSLLLGIHRGYGDNGQTAVTVVIIVVAFFKFRLIGLYFMELRNAPVKLRGAFECYVAGVCGTIIAMYLVL